MDKYMEIPQNPLFLIRKGMATLTRKIKAKTCAVVRLPLWPNCVFQSRANTRNIIQATYIKDNVAAVTSTSTSNAVTYYIILNLLTRHVCFLPWIFTFVHTRKIKNPFKRAFLLWSFKLIYRSLKAPFLNSIGNWR